MSGCRCPDCLAADLTIKAAEARYAAKQREAERLMLDNFNLRASLPADVSLLLSDKEAEAAHHAGTIAQTCKLIGLDPEDGVQLPYRVADLVIALKLTLARVESALDDALEDRERCIGCHIGPRPTCLSHQAVNAARKALGRGAL